MKGKLDIMRKNKEGFTLIELLLSLGVIATIIIAVFFIFKKAEISYKAKEEANRIIRISNVYENNVPIVVATGEIVNDNYAEYKDGTTMLIELYKLEGLVPKDAKNGEYDEFSNMTTAVFVNKFGGKTTINPTSIEMTHVPIEACGIIVNPIIASIGDKKTEDTISCSEAMKSPEWSNSKGISTGTLIYLMDEKSIGFLPNDGNDSGPSMS